MTEFQNNLDLKEFGRRCAVVRKRLGMTQIELAKQLGTTQYQISRVEGGGKVHSSLMINLLSLFSKSMSMNKLFAQSFDEEDDELINAQYALNSIVKAKLDILKEELLEKLADSQREIKKQIDEASELLL